MDRKSLRYSLYLHLSPLLFLLILHGCSGNGNGKDKDGKENGNGKNNNHEIKEKDKKEEPVQITLQYGSTKSKPLNKVHDRDCKNGFYGGIGIYSDVFDEQVVSRIVRGYVGSDIGLEKGDRIVSPAEDTIKGEVGSELTLVVRKKNGDIKTYLILRDKICLNGKG